MLNGFDPVPRQSLADGLAQRIRQLIQEGGYDPGDRLPAITEMARRFGVGHPTLREALKKLETVGTVDIRHGSGVYVGKNQDALVVSNPVYGGTVSKKLLIDLMDARIPVELKTVALAARNAGEEHLEEMRRLLAHARENLENAEVLTPTNLGFHQQIAIASGNTVLRQILTVLSDLFQDEQRAILDIYSFWQQDYAEHVGILQALEQHDEALAVERMRAHLEGVRDVLIRWDPPAEAGPRRERHSA
jgi:GntR family transcriptional regulator, transcriptional repressor for pyruvate dehydrogenase complex